MDYYLFVFIAPFAAVALLSVLIWMWPRRTTPGAGEIMILSIGSLGWLVCNTLEQLDPTAAGTLFWAQKVYIFAALVTCTWPVFALRYTGRTQWLKPGFILTLYIIPTISVVLLHLPSWQHLMWVTIDYTWVGQLLTMHVEPGPWYRISTVYSYLLTLGGAALILWQNVRTFPIYRRQSLWMTGGVLSSIGLSIIYVLHVIPGWTKDYTPIGLALSSLLFTIGLFRTRLFELVPIARDVLIENMNDAVIVLDRQNRIVDINQAMLRLIALAGHKPQDSGPSETALIGQEVGAVLASQANLPVNTINDLLQKTSAAGEVQDAFYIGPEPLRWFDLRSAPVHGHDGHLLGRQVVAHEITSLKQAEDALRQANDTLANHVQEIERQKQQLERQNAELVEAARLRDDVENMTRHDLRGPLNLIILAPRMILQHPNLPSDLIQPAQIIEDAGLEMLKLVNHSLDLFKIERGTYEVDAEEVNIVHVLAKVVTHLTPEASKQQVRIALNRNGGSILEGEALILRGEELLCYSLLMNLIRNAIEGSPACGRVDISLSVEKEMVIIAIHNQGVVPADIRNRFFEKYVTFGKRKGTGLGTYSARRFAEVQGGSVEMTTSEEQGTTLTVRLPGWDYDPWMM